MFNSAMTPCNLTMFCGPLEERKAHSFTAPPLCYTSCPYLKVSMMGFFIPYTGVLHLIYPMHIVPRKGTCKT